MGLIDLEPKSSVKVEVFVQGSPSIIVLTVSLDEVSVLGSPSIIVLTRLFG